MSQEAIENLWISQRNSDHVRAKRQLQEVLSGCYLNLFLVSEGAYDKTFDIMSDDDFVEYVDLLEKLHTKKKIASIK